MSESQQDIAFGGFLVDLLVEKGGHRPLVKNKYKSVGWLHAELVFHGMRLVNKQQDGPAGGHMLFYLKGRVLVRVKTRGSGGRFRGGVPHLTVSLLSGVMKDGAVDLGFGAETGEFNAEGRLDYKSAPTHLPDHDEKKSPAAKGNNEVWSDETHFDFEDAYLDDHAVERL